MELPRIEHCHSHNVSPLISHVKALPATSAATHSQPKRILKFFVRFTFWPGIQEHGLPTRWPLTTCETNTKTKVMKDKFNEMAKRLAQSVSRTLVCLPLSIGGLLAG